MGLLSALSGGFRLAAVFGLLMLLPLFGCSEKAQTDEDALESARQAYSIGHFTEAERIYQHYLQANPEGDKRWEAWNRLLDISVNVLGDYEKSASLLDSMYLEFGNDPERAWDLLVELGDLHENARNWPAAVEVWKKTLSQGFMTPRQRAKTALRLARIYRMQQEFGQAERVLETCVEQAEDDEIKARCLYEAAQNVEYRLRKAQAQTIENKDKQIDEAELQERIRLILERIRSLEGVEEERFALATFMLADLLESQGKTDDARKLFASIVETYPNPMVVRARLEHLN